MIRELVREILSRYGSFVEFPKGRTFDFFYEDELRRLIIKALRDIESLRRDLAEDLKRYSYTFKASPLVVSLKRKREKLQEGVVYLRHGLPAISPKTLEKALRGELPIFLEYRGGLRMFLSSEALESYSRSYLSEVLEVSKKAVYEYQRGLGVSASKYERVVKYLGEEAIRRIDIFDRKVEPSEGSPKGDIDQKIARIAREFSKAFRLERRPGRSALINDELRIVFSLEEKEAKKLYERKAILKAYTILIGKSEEVPSLKPEELERISKEDLIELIG